MDADVRERLEELEARLLRLEAQLGGDAPQAGADAAEVSKTVDQRSMEEDVADEVSGENLEFEVGQVWFSRVGITVLALGAAFAISLPYPGTASWIPAGCGFAFAALVILCAHLWSGRLGQIAGFLRGGGCILMYFAALRLFFFGEAPALEPQSFAGALVLLAVPALSLAMAAFFRSSWLAAIGLTSACASAIILPVPWLSMGVLVVVALASSLLNARNEWRGLLILSVMLGFVSFLMVMLNRPIVGNPIRWNIEPSAAPVVAIVLTLIFGAGSLFRRVRVDGREAPSTVITSLLNCGIGFLVFLSTTEALAEQRSGVPYLVVTVVYLGVATAFWMRERSRWSTFAYAMTGYLALSVAIQALSESPDVFVWLSLQSLLVVVTAVWFQSRFIVTANFIIYLATIAGYLAVAGTGSGITIVFGAVALASARILAWQKDRLHLRTEFMRNGYLLCGFLAFPFAAYHLVPSQFVALSWVAIAVFYYLMNLAVNSPKYRWMGHGTLLGTVLYVIIVGIIQLKPAFRILSFAVLGVVLVGVSIVFSVIRGRRQSPGSSSQTKDLVDRDRADGSV